MNFKKERTRDYYLGDTHVENIFINEFMAGAPGDYVKVYLFALMYADIGMMMSNTDIARHLGLRIEEVLQAWSWWEEQGVICKHHDNPADQLHYEVEFLNLKARVYGKKSKKSAAKLSESVAGMMASEEMRNLYHGVEQLIGTPLSTTEMQEILSWITDLAVSEEIILYAWKFAVEKRKKKSVRYVGTILREWCAKDLHTIAAINRHLQENDQRHYQYNRVLKALGMSPPPTEEAKRLMDSWFDDMKFDMDTVLEACKRTIGIRNPNVKYVHKTLEGWHRGDARTESRPAPGEAPESRKNAVAEVLRYYETLREREETAAEERRKEVYGKVPRIRELDDAIRRSSMEISKVMLSGAPGSESRTSVLRKEIDAMQSEKSWLMTENNFRVDYMDIAYVCPECRDTGVRDNGERCACFARRLEKIQKSLQA